jgi:hypothetical protein
MNLERIYKSKSLLVFLIIVLIGVISIFVVLLKQQSFEGTQTPSPLTQQDQSNITSVVKDNLSEDFTADELEFTNFKGDHNWAIALVYSTNENIDPNFVLMKNNGSKWEVAYGPATDADPEELKKLGAPQELIDQIDDVFVPPGIPQ